MGDGPGLLVNVVGPGVGDVVRVRLLVVAVGPGAGQMGGLVPVGRARHGPGGGTAQRASGLPPPHGLPVPGDPPAPGQPLTNSQPRHRAAPFDVRRRPHAAREASIAARQVLAVCGRLPAIIRRPGPRSYPPDGQRTWPVGSPAAPAGRRQHWSRRREYPRSVRGEPGGGHNRLAEADPPSLHGTLECTRTRNPCASSWPTVACSSRRFWNTPPDSATVLRWWRSRSLRQQSVMRLATPLWKRAAMTLRSVPAARSSTTARTRSGPATRSGSSPVATGPVPAGARRPPRSKPARAAIRNSPPQIA